MANPGKKKRIAFQIFRYLCLAGYLAAAAILISESATVGSVSAEHSTSVGDTISDVIESIHDDFSETIPPTSLKINEPISSLAIGEQRAIAVTIQPDNTKFLGVDYASSLESVATIDANGLITALSAGETTITAANSSYPDIKDSFLLTVYEVPVTSISSSIHGLAANEGIYTLNLSSTYAIDTSFLPENATESYKRVSYSVSSDDGSSYLRVSDSGVITPLHYSGDVLSSILVTCGECSSTLRVKVTADNAIAPTSITLRLSATTIDAGQTCSASVAVSPTTIWNGYSLSSSDPSIASVSGNAIRGVKEGDATITATSTYDPSISSSVPLHVNPQPLAQISKLYFSNPLYIGESKKVSLTYAPSYGKKGTVEFSSSDEGIASVDGSGNVYGVSLGTAEITATSNGSSASISVHVQEKPLPVEPKELTEISLSQKAGEMGVTFLTGQRYDIRDYVNISLTPSDADDQDLEFSFLREEDGVFEGTSFLLYRPTTSLTLYATHHYSSAAQDLVSAPLELSCTVLAPLTATLSASSEGEALPSSLSLAVKQSLVFHVSCHEEMSYSLAFAPNESFTIARLGDDTYEVEAWKEGESSFSLVPSYQGKEYGEFALRYALSSFDVHASELKLSMKEDGEVFEGVGKEYVIHAKKTALLLASTDAAATRSEMSYSSSDPRVATISNRGEIQTLKAGKTTIAVIEEVSGLSKSFDLIVKNRVLLRDDAITVKGQNLAFEDGVYTLVNGNAYSLSVNFDAKSTYTTATFVSSDPAVLAVSPSGALTPMGLGKATITIRIDDGQTGAAELRIPEMQVSFAVRGKNLAEAIKSFYLIVRKLLGHFLAFGAFGLLSAFVYALFFAKKDWKWSLPFSFLQGFGLACLTELIQRFTEGRYGCWSDVGLDFGGFSAFCLLVWLLLLLFLVGIPNAKKKRAMAGNPPAKSKGKPKPKGKKKK